MSLVARTIVTREYILFFILTYQFVFHIFLFFFLLFFSFLKKVFAYSIYSMNVYYFCHHLIILVDIIIFWYSCMTCNTMRILVTTNNNNKIKNTHGVVNYSHPNYFMTDISTFHHLNYTINFVVLSRPMFYLLFNYKSGTFRLKN